MLHGHAVGNHQGGAEVIIVSFLKVVYPPSNACLSYLDNRFGCLTSKTPVYRYLLQIERLNTSQTSRYSQHAIV